MCLSKPLYVLFFWFNSVPKRLGLCEALWCYVIEQATLCHVCTGSTQVRNGGVNVKLYRVMLLSKPLYAMFVLVQLRSSTVGVKV